MKPDTPTSRQERFALGKELRKTCPRSSHGETGLGKGKRDPLKLIESSNGGRVEHLLPVRFGRMAESAFAFFRGTANLQAHDLAKAPSSGIQVQNCGDCHLMNFGGFASPERKLIFDMSDFDETFPAPFEWDLKRLATSFVVASRWLELTPKECRESAAMVVSAYRENMVRFAQMKLMSLWYAQIPVQDLLNQVEGDSEVRKRVKKAMEKAEQSTGEQVFHKITRQEGGGVRILDQPPLLFHVDQSLLNVKRTVLPFFKAYKETLRADYRVLFERFHFADVAFKVVGVGSVGTYCFVALFLAENDDPLFLQVKEARPSVLEGVASGGPKIKHNGERIIAGQRLMQSASDIFLGWSKEPGAKDQAGKNPEGKDFYIRQLRDLKVSVDLAGYNPKLLNLYARLCGQALARAHAKAGDSATIAGYIGTGTGFDDALARYAVAYADQVEADFALFQSAIKTGRFATNATPQGMEQAL